MKNEKGIFEELEKINSRPEPFEFYTARDLWTDEHTSKKMLFYHLNEEVDLSSRNAGFIDRSTEWISSHFHVEAGMKIADFGCGPGLYTTRLAKMQADVTGIDFSKSSIQYAQQAAKKEGLIARYVNENYLEFETEDRFDLIMMIMCDFCALSPIQRKTILSKFHRLLAPSGSVLVDVYSLTTFEQRKEAAGYEANSLDGFWASDKYYGFLNTFKYEMEKVILDKYTIVEAGRIRIFYNWLQCFSPKTLEKEFAECGFRIENFYSDVAGLALDLKTEEFAVVAKKL